MRRPLPGGNGSFVAACVYSCVVCFYRLLFLLSLYISVLHAAILFVPVSFSVVLCFASFLLYSHYRRNISHTHKQLFQTNFISRLKLELFDAVSSLSFFLSLFLSFPVCVFCLLTFELSCVDVLCLSTIGFVD